MLLGTLSPTQAFAQAAPCQYTLGFATLATMIPHVVGTCLDNETYNPAMGDAVQHTTRGMLVWRKADNWSAFTDGYRTWINGPLGLQERLNTDLFQWEINEHSDHVAPLLLDVDGAAEEDTPAFNPSGPWFLIWSYACFTQSTRNFSITFLNGRHVPTGESMSEGFAPSGSGMTEFFQPGYRYMDVVAGQSCRWQVTVSSAAPLLNVTGSGAGTTQFFNPPGTWFLIWSYACDGQETGLFSVSFLRSSDAATGASMLESRSALNSGTAEIVQSGPQYMVVQSNPSCHWRVTVMG